MNIVKKLCVLISILQISVIDTTGQKKIFPGADESTSSKSEYFSWINNTNEGSTEEQTLTNLEFFKWLKDEYGMNLDIYALDAGAIDGKKYIGNMESEKFKRQFPNSFSTIYEMAKLMDIHLGIWGGPDCFGDTPESEKARIDMMVKLCRDFGFELFKFDAVNGKLRPEKQDAFIEMMTRCRQYSPNLILLNHRLELGKGMPYATTFLWEAKETYIDAQMPNEVTAPHHRATALSRGLPPGLNRLTEDHGVCLSSCLDYWDDDLVLQAFNRSLILAPQIYGNPWLLRDDEFPKLARIFNLHEKFKDILINGKVLPEAKYGPYAVSRGDGNTRIITLRNLTWNTQNYDLKLDEEIGLENGKSFEVRQFHPTEKILGRFKYKTELKIEVFPFRSCLLIVSEKIDEPAVSGIDFQVIKNIEGAPVEIQLLGLPGTTSTISLKNYRNYNSVILNDFSNENLLKGKQIDISFPGEKLTQSTIRQVDSGFNAVNLQDVNWEELYETTVFSADNNAMEVRSIQRSGWSTIPAVKKAQDFFFNQAAFVERGVWDKNLFDGNLNTGFWQKRKNNIDVSVNGGCLRLDLGEITYLDNMVIKVGDIFSLEPLPVDEGNWVEVSKDLKTWKNINYLANKEMLIEINDSVRYLRFAEFPQRIIEIEGYCKGKALNRDNWKASNLFAHTSKLKCSKIWETEIILSEIAPGSYLSIALDGKHGVDGAYVTARIDGKLIGSPDRAPSYQSNVWVTPNARRDKNYTYYIPIDKSIKGKKVEVFVMGFDESNQDFEPKVFINTQPNSMEKISLILNKK